MRSGPEEALAILQREAGEKGQAASAPTVLSEMADIYGMLGGIHRRWAPQLTGSARSDHLVSVCGGVRPGFVLERDSAGPQGSTYNRINRLVARVLLDPSLLTSTSEEGRRLIQELEVAERLVRDQLDRVRVKDPWAYCDLLTLELLLEAAHGPGDADRPGPVPATPFACTRAPSTPLSRWPRRSGRTARRSTTCWRSSAGWGSRCRLDRPPPTRPGPGPIGRPARLRCWSCCCWCTRPAWWYSPWPGPSRDCSALAPS